MRYVKSSLLVLITMLTLMAAGQPGPVYISPAMTPVVGSLTASNALYLLGGTTNTSPFNYADSKTWTGTNRWSLGYRTQWFDDQSSGYSNSFYQVGQVIGSGTVNYYATGAVTHAINKMTGQYTNTGGISVPSVKVSGVGGGVTLDTNLVVQGGFTANTISTLTSNNIMSVNNLGASIIPALWLTNATDAALGAQQSSPALMFGGQGWRSGNSTTMPVQMGFQAIPVQGSSANPTISIYPVMSISNSAPVLASSYCSISSVGDVSGRIVIAGYNIRVGANNSLNLYYNSAIFSPLDGDIQFVDNGSNTFSRLFLGPKNDSWPNLRISSTNAPTIEFRSNGALSNYVSLAASNVTATAGGTFFHIASSNGVAGLDITQQLGKFASLGWTNDAGTAVVLGNNAYQTVTNASRIITNGFAVDVNKTYLTNQVAGFYKIFVKMDWSGAQAADIFECEVNISGTGNDFLSFRSMPSANNAVQSGSGSDIVYLPANSYLSMNLKNQTGARNATMYRASLVISTP